MSTSIIVNCCSGVWSLIRITNVGWDGYWCAAAAWSRVCTLIVSDPLSADQCAAFRYILQLTVCSLLHLHTAAVDQNRFEALLWTQVFWKKMKSKPKFNAILQGNSILNLFSFWKCVLIIIYSFVFNKLNSYARFPPISKTLIDWWRVGRLEMVPGLKMRVASVMIWCPPGTWPTGYQ